MSAQSAIFNPSQTTSAATGDGFSVPRLTTTGRLAIAFGTGDSGMMVYDTTLNNLFIWTGSAWESVPASGDAGINGAVQYNDNGVVSGAINFVYNKVNQKVGIGTITPNVELDVVGSATISGDLTVRTNKLTVTNTGVGIGMTPITPLSSVLGTTGAVFFRTTDPAAPVASPYIQTPVSTGFSSTNPVYGFWYQNSGMGNPASNELNWIIGSAESMRLNSTGLGVGVSPSYKLDVLGPSTISGRFKTAGAINALYLEDAGTTAASLYIGTSGNTFRIITGNNVRMNVDVNGNVGIGVTPSAWAANAKALQISSFVHIAQQSNGSSNVGFACYESSTNAFEYSTTGDSPTLYSQLNGQHKFFTAPSGTAGNAITFTQAMTLDASGNLLVGATSALASGSTFQNLGTSRQVLTLKGDAFGSYTAGIWNASTTNDSLFVYFGTETALTVRGGISYNRGGGLVAYNTTSDYRAKDIIGPVSNSGSLVDSLKVYIGKMHGATIARPMLIAHEAQEVAPYAVTGTKDEVDADGNPKYQQMDVSALVPVLIAEIQSLRARVQTLEAR